MAKAEKIALLVQKLDARFQSVANIVTSWSGTTSDEKYPSEKLVKDSLDTKEATANKVSSWTGTTANDNYPSEKLVKGELDLKENASNKVTSVTSWSETLSDAKYPSEKLVKEALNNKLEAADLPTKTSDLTNDGEDGTTPFLTAHQSLDSKTVTVEKLSTAETGYAHSYAVKQNGSQVGATINIPKDYLVKSGELKTVASADLTTLGNGYSVGDKYLDFVVNTKGNDGTDEHIYINVKDLVEDTTYTADEDTLTLSNEEFSIKAGGVDTTELADGAVTTAKLATDAVTTVKIVDDAVTGAKIDDGAITADHIASSLSSTWLTTANVDSEIEDYIDALTTALTPASEPGE